MNEISEDLISKASTLPTYEDPEPPHWTRCKECHEQIYNTPITDITPTYEPALAHLLRNHGYRMNGRRYDNQNQEILDEE